MPALTTSSKKGFTLIELMVTISIIAIIAAVGITTFSQAQKLGRDARRKQDLRSLSIALELFYQKNGRYPCSGTNWVASNAANWLSDSTACGGSGLNISPAFISSSPKDPTGINNGSPWATNQRGYGYHSWNTTYNGCAQGTYYILITQLENPDDPDRLGNKPDQVHPVCGVNLGTASSYSLNSYIITMP